MSASWQGQTLAEWPQRALGWLVDWGIGVGGFLVVYIIGLILGAVSSALAVLFLVIAVFGSLGWTIWLAVQLGQTGQTPGMRLIGLKAIKSDTGQPLGAGTAVLRWLVHVVLQAACTIPGIVDYLFPLWDQQKQTLADKAVGSVILVVPKQGFSLVPPPQQQSGY